MMICSETQRSERTGVANRSEGDIMNHVKISDICGEMKRLDIFCIGRSEFAFHLDGELNRDG